MKPYSMDLRERIVGAVEAGERAGGVAQRFGVSERTVRAYRLKAMAGQLAPRPIPGKAPRVAKEQEDAFVAMVGEKSDWTIEALCQEWHARTGILLPRSTLYDHLKRVGGRFKKKSPGV